MRSMAPHAVLAQFDELPPCEEQMLRGRWSGEEIFTGHPLDGSLANVSWYGKQFDSAGEVHPLLVADSGGNPFPLDPALVPMLLITHPISTPDVVKCLAPKVMTLLRPVAQARRHGAHLEEVRHRGIRTVSMVYNDRPIVDVFRTIDADTVLGCMEYPGMPRPHFFVLQRDNQGDNSVQ